MSDSTIPSAGQSPAPVQEMIPPAIAQEIRRLTHDLSNAIEILTQTSYLLGMAGLQDPAAEWLKLLEVGVTKTTAINAELRSYIRDHSLK